MFSDIRSFMFLLIATLVFFGSANQAYSQCPGNQNLIFNPGGEGQPALTGNTDHDVLDWAFETGTFTVIRYDQGGGFPTASSPGPPARGNYFFSGGPASGNSSGVQSADISACAAIIDTGLIQYDLSGYFGGFAGQNDRAQLTVTFQDVNDSPLSTVTIGPVTSAERSNVTGLIRRSTTGTVPIGTRRVEFTLTMIQQSGDNDGYADNLIFTMLVPTAASVSVSGRVVDEFGRSVSGAAVTLTGSGSGVQTARTNPFGYFRFEEVAAGQSYVIEVRHKRFVFDPLLIAANDSIEDLLLVARGGESIKDTGKETPRNP